MYTIVIDCGLHIFLQAINNEAAQEGIFLMQEIMKMTAASQGTLSFTYAMQHEHV